MKKPIFFVIIFCAVLVPIFVTQSILKKEKTTRNSSLQLIKKQLPQNLEIAKTPQERSIGLMNRDSLCETCGMLFVFDFPAIQSFWMKNTKIPLDMIFLDETGKVITIHENTVPFQESPTYQSSKPAKYVLEVTGGWSQKLPLNVDDSFDISKL
jgi:uncharacterized membrane protein (UPF0127 family)